MYSKVKKRNETKMLFAKDVAKPLSAAASFLSLRSNGNKVILLAVLVKLSFGWNSSCAKLCCVGRFRLDGPKRKYQMKLVCSGRRKYSEVSFVIVVNATYASDF